MDIKKIIFAIIVVIAAFVAAQPVGINFIIVCQEIPNDDNGFIVNAQVSKFDDNHFIIKVAPHIIGDPQQNKIVAHEIGHINDWDADEAFADDFANKVVPEGEPIVDAYHGIH